MKTIETEKLMLKAILIIIGNTWIVGSILLEGLISSFIMMVVGLGMMWRGIFLK